MRAVRRGGARRPAGRPPTRLAGPRGQRRQWRADTVFGRRRSPRAKWGSDRRERACDTRGGDGGLIPDQSSQAGGGSARGPVHCSHLRRSAAIHAQRWGGGGGRARKRAHRKSPCPSRRLPPCRRLFRRPPRTFRRPPCPTPPPCMQQTSAHPPVATTPAYTTRASVTNAYVAAVFGRNIFQRLFAAEGGARRGEVGALYGNGMGSPGSPQGKSDEPPPPVQEHPAQEPQPLPARRRPLQRAAGPGARAAGGRA